MALLQEALSSNPRSHFLQSLALDLLSMNQLFNKPLVNLMGVVHLGQRPRSYSRKGLNKM